MAYPALQRNDCEHTVSTTYEGWKIIIHLTAKAWELLIKQKVATILYACFEKKI